MELDKRIKEGKRPLMCFDLKEAEQFVGEKGYFSDCLFKFQNLDDCSKSVLHCIDDKRFDDYIFNDGKYYCRFFLPEAYVIPEEPKKKYRPYSLAEWIEQHEVGEFIKFRNSNMQEFHVMYSGYIFDTNDDIQDIRTKGQIMLLSSPYSFQELFDNYEIKVNGEWLPFGVIDE